MDAAIAARQAELASLKVDKTAGEEKARLAALTNETDAGEDAHKRKDFVRSLAAYDAALGIATEAEAAGIAAARARRWRKYSQVIFSKYPNICITERPLSDLVLVRVVVVHRLHPSQRHVLLVELRFTPGSTAGNYIRRQRLGS